MEHRYLRLVEASQFTSGWFLGEPTTAAGAVDPRRFASATKYEGPVPLSLPIKHDGIPLDFTFGPFGMPVVSGRVARIVRELAGPEVQLVPSLVGEKEQGHAVLNVLRTMGCLDEAESRVSRWTESDGRPEKVGQYRMIEEVCLDGARIDPECRIFRLEGWKVAMIVREDLWAAIGGPVLEGLKGIRLRVSGGGESDW